jgi:hypothetical protein
MTILLFSIKRTCFVLEVGNNDSELISLTGLVENQSTKELALSAPRPTDLSTNFVTLYKALSCT